VNTEGKKDICVVKGQLFVAKNRLGYNQAKIMRSSLSLFLFSFTTSQKNTHTQTFIGEIFKS